MKFLESLLKQEPGWYDTQKTQEISSKANLHCSKVETALATNCPDFINFAATAVISLIFAYLKGWHLALVVSLFVPIFSYVSSFTMKGFILIGTESAKVYAKSGGIANQTFKLFKTIICCNQEKKEIDNYRKALESA